MVTPDYDVIVVGYGPVGAGLAGLIGAAGHKVLVVESTDLSKASPRAINMDDQSMVTLVQDLGLGDAWTKTTMPFPGGNFVSGYPDPQWLGIGQLADDKSNPIFGAITMAKEKTGFNDVVFYQPELERQLREKVESISTVTVKLNRKVSSYEEIEDGKVVRVTCVPTKTEWQRTTGGEWIPADVLPGPKTEETHTCSFLVACDGAKSTVRQLMFTTSPSSCMNYMANFAMAAVDKAMLAVKGSVQSEHTKARRGDKLVSSLYEETWLVVDCLLHDESLLGSRLPHAGQQICDADRPSTMVPGSWVWDPQYMEAGGKPGRHYRWEFLLDLSKDDPLALVEDEAVYELLKPWVTPKEVTIVRSATYTARPSDAIQWQKGRVFLAGDAAHTTPPFLGQGLNQGYRDARNLAWKIELNLRGIGGQRLLDTYSLERRHVCAHMAVGACDVGNKIAYFSKALKEGPEALEKAKASLTDSGNADTYGHVGGKWGSPVSPPLGGPLCYIPAGESKDTCPMVGLILAQPEVTVAGKTSRLYDLLGTGFSLLYNGDIGGDSSICPKAMAEGFASVGGMLVGIKPSENGGKEQFLEGVFAKYDAVMVRPDHYVYGLAKCAEVEIMIESLLKFLGQKDEEVLTVGARDGVKHTLVPLTYDGNLEALCEALSKTIAQLNGEPDIVITVGIEKTTTTSQEAISHLKAFRRLMRLSPYPVACHIKTEVLKPTDVLVALSCDTVESDVKELTVLDGQAAPMARRFWRLYSGKFPEGTTWMSSDLLCMKHSIINSVKGFLPSFWMALRISGMAKVVGGGIEDSAVGVAGFSKKQSNSAFNFYFGPKVACLFSAFDAVTGRAGSSTEFTAVAAAAMTVTFEETSAVEMAVKSAVSCSRISANEALLELTSDIILMPTAAIQARCRLLMDEHITHIQVKLRDGKVASSFNIFPKGASNHYDMYKWHRAWEQFLVLLNKRHVTCTVEGREICPPLMELFFSSKVRVWNSPHRLITFCQRPFAYTPGPSSMSGALGQLSVAQLRQLLLAGASIPEATAWKIVHTEEEAAKLVKDSKGEAEAEEAHGEPMQRRPSNKSKTLHRSVAGAGVRMTRPSKTFHKGSLDSAVPGQDSHWVFGGGFLGHEADVQPGEHVRPAVPRGCCSLLGYGLSVPGPEHRWTQQQVATMLGVKPDHKYHSVMVASHIKTRYLAELERDLAQPKTVNLKRLAEKHLYWAQIMLNRAIKAACADAGIAPSDLNHIVIASSTGFALPGLTAYCIQDKELGIPMSVSREDIVGMGCHAGLNSFKAAAAWAVANPGKYSIAIGVEVMSAQYVWGDVTRNQLNTIICNSLFGDGCGAFVFRASPPGEVSPPKAYLDAPPSWWAQMCDTAALTDMIYNVEESEGKYRFDLSELAPYHVGQGLFTLMHFALYDSIPVHYAEHIITHTGGQTVLDCSSIALGLEGRPKESLPYTIKALREYGNQSSCSFMFAFDNLVKSGKVRADDVGIFVTMGPGAGLEMALWTAGERFEPREQGLPSKPWRVLEPTTSGRRLNRLGSLNPRNTAAFMEASEALPKATSSSSAAWDMMLAEFETLEDAESDSSDEEEAAEQGEVSLSADVGEPSLRTTFNPPEHAVVAGTSSERTATQEAFQAGLRDLSEVDLVWRLEAIRSELTRKVEV